MKKGGTGRGGGVARVQNTICIQREKKKKKKKLGEERAEGEGKILVDIFKLDIFEYAIK